MFLYMNECKCLYFRYTYSLFIDVPSGIADVSFIQVGHPEKITCDGKCGGSYQWKGHDFRIMLPPGCADETVTVILDALLPSSTQEDCLISAVFNVTTNVETFKKSVTVHIPHCANIKSEEDKDRLNFLVVHKNSHELKKGHFEVGKSYGSIELKKFSMLAIVDELLSVRDLLSSFIQSGLAKPQAATDVKLKERHTSGANHKKITRRYLDLLILPKSNDEKWFGKYCIIQDISTYWQVNIKL